MALSKEDREAFLRRYGWTPELPEEKRKEIEDYWYGDDGIEYAIAMGG